MVVDGRSSLRHGDGQVDAGVGSDLRPDVLSIHRHCAAILAVCVVAVPALRKAPALKFELLGLTRWIGSQERTWDEQHLEHQSRLRFLPCMTFAAKTQQSGDAVPTYSPDGTYCACSRLATCALQHHRPKLRVGRTACDMCRFRCRRRGVDAHTSMFFTPALRGYVPSGKGGKVALMCCTESCKHKHTSRST